MGGVHVTFSGGKDSTVLLDIVRKIYPDVPAVYCDTGLEYPEIKEFVKTHDNVTIIRPKMGFRKVIETYGYPIISKEVAMRVVYARRYLSGEDVGKWAYNDFVNPRLTKNGDVSMYDRRKYAYLLNAPFKISNECCAIMKKEPLNRYSKEHKSYPMTGMMAQESKLRQSNWYKNGCNAFDAQHPISSPLAFWKENDILEYIDQYHLPYCKVYGDIVKDKKGKYCTTGCSRTGCVFCAFGAQTERKPNRFQRLKQTHPQLWEYCMRPWDEGGLGMKEVLEYINVPWE